VRIGSKQQRAAALCAGDTAEVELVPLEDWPEPKVPRDLQAGLAAAPDQIQELWKDITPMARWEWVHTDARPHRRRPHYLRHPLL
jgi:hypothetical protein